MGSEKSYTLASTNQTRWTVLQREHGLIHLDLLPLSYDREVKDLVRIYKTVLFEFFTVLENKRFFQLDPVPQGSFIRS